MTCQASGSAPYRLLGGHRPGGNRPAGGPGRSAELKINGELVIWNGDRLDFSQLQRRLASPSRAAALARALPASYVLFDVLQYGGRDLSDEPQRARRRQLESILHTLTPPCRSCPPPATGTWPPGGSPTTAGPMWGSKACCSQGLKLTN